jgi:hypothetical protein
MKSIAVILLLTIQMGLLLNKTFTIVHFFLHRAEIVEHFCHHATHQEEENCNGICYLQAQLGTENTAPDKNFPVQSLVQDDVVYFETLPTFIFSPNPIGDKILTNYVVNAPVLQNTHLSVWRPPTA